MSNDIAVFLDLDNLVIGAKQANIVFDINLILDKVKALTNGRIVLRRSYGDWRQGQKLLKELATAGFTTQSTVRLNNFSKNLADMQIVVDTMDTLIDGHQYSTYVLISGDRDFTPLVQSLRKRGKQVIGVGVKHTASPSLVGLCDHYIYYEDLLTNEDISDLQVDELLDRALSELLNGTKRVRASILKQHMSTISQGAFDRTSYAEGSFRKFLQQYPHLVEIEQEDTTIYVRRPEQQAEEPEKALHLQYRTLLKKQKLRVVPAPTRFALLKDIIHVLQTTPEARWRDLVNLLAERFAQRERDVSKNMINATMLLARRSGVLAVQKGASLSKSPLTLQANGRKPFQEAVVRCDAAYLREILGLSEPFDIEEAALALYENKQHAAYLQRLVKDMDNLEL